MQYLDFEQPIADLEKKIDELQEISVDDEVLKPEIDRLRKKADQLRESIFTNLTRWQRVQLARHPERPYTLDYIERITEDFIELHGDRYHSDDKAIVGGLATIDGQSVMIMGHQKGRDTKSRQYRNFGMANPEGYRKAYRLMKLAEKFGIPVVTLLDTPGAFPGLEAEERGQAEAIARKLKMMAVLEVPILSIVIGEGNPKYCNWRRCQRWSYRYRNGERGLHDGKYLVLGYCSRIVFVHIMENLGLQRAGCFCFEANSKRPTGT